MCLLRLMAFALVGKIRNKKRVSYFYRAAQLSTLAVFPPWGSSRGAGRKRLTPAQI
jgi:hypothetical protein